MYTVTGMIDGVGYEATVSDTATGTPLSFGLLATPSARLLAALYMREGTDVMASPTGPTLTLDSSDPESIMAALGELTDGIESSGDVPDFGGAPDVADLLF